MVNEWGDPCIKLGELGKLLSYNEPLKIIGRGTGKVLIHRYNKDKHEHLADLEITGIFTELELSGCVAKNHCYTRLVGWASDYQYKELKEAYNGKDKG